MIGWIVMKNAAECLCLIGVPGSGKSTLRGKINGDHIVISSDDIIEEYAQSKGLTYNDVFGDDYVMKLVRNKIKRLTDHARRYDIDVIWDQTNLTPKSRKKVFKALPNHKVIALVFPTPDEEELTKRLDRPGKTIPDHVMERMKGQFTYPTPGEGFIKIIEYDEDQL